MHISNAVRDALKNTTCEGPFIRLTGRLDPPVDEGVRRVLLRSGASWSHRHKAYVVADLFPHGDATELVDRIIARRCAARCPDRGVTSCPQSLAALLWDYAQVPAGSQVLEPSAGHGILAAEGAARGCIMDCIEIDPHRAADITRTGIARTVATADFLKLPAQPTYDAVVMYPPHHRTAAVIHLLHAYRFLSPGGVLAALVSPNIQNAAGPRGRELRKLLECAGNREVLDERYFGDGYLLSPSGIRLGAQLLFLYADDEPPGN